MADKRRFRGPGGGVFVPHPTVAEETLEQHVKLGEWVEVEETKPAPSKKAAAKPASDQ